MTSIWLQVITGLVGMFTLMLKEYYSPDRIDKRKDDAREKEIQQGRKDIADGNTTAVSQRIDRLLH